MHSRLFETHLGEPLPNGFQGELLKKLTAFLLTMVLSWSCALPVYAKRNKVKVTNPEALAALKRNKAQQKKMRKLAKSLNRDRLHPRTAR